MTVSIDSLEAFLAIVGDLREKWGRTASEELWFRAEDAEHRPTRLQPGLYRPRMGSVRKPVQELLSLEGRLYEEFYRCLAQVSPADARTTDEDWDPYFLMQHYGVPTRILDWTDGSLISLHFAVRDKPLKPTTDSIIYVLDPHWLLEWLEEQLDQARTAGRWRKYCRKRGRRDKDENDWDEVYLPSGADNPE